MYFRCHYFVLSEISLVSDTIHKLVYSENNNHSILNMTVQALSRDDRRGTQDHIGHLISVRAVPALGTSLFVVSAYLHAQEGGALQRPGKIYSNQHTCNSRSFQYYKWTRNYSRTSVS